jgi:hypothetical protein
MTPADVAKLVDGYKVILLAATVFVQPRDAADADRFRKLGAHVTETPVRGGVAREAHLPGLLDEPTETDDDGKLLDNRAEVLRSYFREQLGLA